MLKNFKVRRRCTVPSPLTSPSNKKSYGTETFASTRLSGLLQGPTVDPVYRDPPVHGHNTGFVCRWFLSPIGAARERPEIGVKSPLVSPVVIFPRVYLLNSFLQRDTSARQQRF